MTPAPATAAWKLTGDRQYSDHAAKHLRAWFVDPATRMNPNLQYAQAIHGRFTGRVQNKIYLGDQTEFSIATAELGGVPQAWITEAQAEPWESAPNRYADPKSTSPQAIRSLFANLKEAGFSTVLFWGAEYWVLRERSGDPSYLQAFARILDRA